MNGNSFVQSWHGIPREEVAWCPTLVPERCNGCGLCVTSCDRRVLAFDYAKNLPVVVNGLNCMVGCTACAAVCLRDALELPCRGLIRQFIHEQELPRHSEAELHAGREIYDAHLRDAEGGKPKIP
jgi:CDP-4-dehydro-6-deoxyglucose reductase